MTKYTNRKLKNKDSSIVCAIDCREGERTELLANVLNN